MYQQQGSIELGGHGSNRFIKFGKQIKQTNRLESTFDPHWSSVILMIGGKDIASPLIDESSFGYSLNLGTVIKSNTRQKYPNESSIFLNNNSILVSNSNFSVTVFTYELWVYNIPNSIYHVCTFSTNNSSGRTLIYVASDNRIYTERFSSGQIHTSPVISEFQQEGWLHIAICRNSSNLYSYYVNGSLKSSTTRSESFGNSTGFSLTTFNRNSSLYIDEVRLTKGVCRYSGSTFELPSYRFNRGSNILTNTYFTFNKIGLQYNPDIPIEHINKRPIYSYGAGGAVITNIPNWQLSYQKPKARISYKYIFFNPLDLSPALWLDADDSSTLTLVSGAVSEWRDKSGNNRHATQATASNRPLLMANELNGTDVIRFNGSNNFLKIDSLFFVGNQFDLFFVFTPRLLNVRQSIFTNGNNEASGMFWIETGSSTSGGNGLATAFTGTFTTIANNIFTVNTPYFSQYTRNNTANTLYNLSISVATSTSNNYLNSNQPSLIGIRRESTLTQPLNGDISQIIIFPRVLTTAEREQIEGYLAWSTGLQGNLPVNHPYKNTHP